MGIPSYFTHIIKNHSNIICKKKNISHINNLYIDSNSVIYDIIYSLTMDELNNLNNIFDKICLKLEFYINVINPEKNVIIAFDGVAPFAKLQQQRTRRNRSVLLNKINNKVSFDTTQITPGTDFMNKLNIYIKNYFNNKIKNKCKYNIIISLSDEPGEGEHKIFKYIRDNKDCHLNENTVIYGLDADLIMLSLLHCEYCSNIYLYREAPEFIKSINHDLNPNELYVLNIKLLGYQICIDLNNFKDINCNIINILIKDYVFMCFLLGNDFIPHSPYLNIRTNGFDIILDVYRSNFSYNNSLIKNDNGINWKNVKKLLEIISNNEKEYLIEEHIKRDKLENRFEKNRNNIENKEDILNNLPIIDRKYEKYINPTINGWESRYYEILFDILYDEERIKTICINYIEALEWSHKYYTIDCPDWRWCYNYHYTPLLSDIIKYIPFYDFSFINNYNTCPVSPITQLSYVLPKESHYILPNRVVDVINKNNIISHNNELIYHYCKYIWECHIDLPRININELENILNQVS
jgi:5'-3' exoribonuclease 1